MTSTTEIVVPASWPARLGARLRRVLAPPTIVLLYHRVAPQTGRDHNQLITRTDHFAAHLAWINRYCRPLHPDEFLSHFQRPRRTKVSLDGGRPRVLITFDDGYADNVQHALPLLRAHRLHAIVFAAGGLIDSGEAYWWDTLERVVFDGTPPPAGWSLPGDCVVPATLDCATAYATLHGQLKPLSHEARRMALYDLARQAGLSSETTADARPMTWAELQAWHAAGMTVGGHTRTHPQLSALTNEELSAEIADDKRDLEQRLDEPIETFAYPYGTGADFDRRCEQAAQAAGYRCAFANRAGNARWAPTPYAIPRCLVRDWTSAELADHFATWCR